MATSVAVAPPAVSTTPKPTPVPPEPEVRQPVEKPTTESAEIAVKQESSKPIIELAPGNEKAFQAQLVEQLADTARDIVSKATLAIPGPNQVALSISKSYSFAVERPGVLGRVKEAASRIAGKAVQIRIDKTDETAASAEGAAATTKQTANLNKAISPEDDPFVQHAVEIFNAKVVRSERL